MIGFIKIIELVMFMGFKVSLELNYGLPFPVGRRTPILATLRTGRHLFHLYLRSTEEWHQGLLNS